MIKMCGKRILHTLRMEISFCLMLESFPAIVLRRICLTATGAPVWRGGRIHNQLYCTYQSNINTTRLSTASLLIYTIHHRATTELILQQKATQQQATAQLGTLFFKLLTFLCLPPNTKANAPCPIKSPGPYSNSPTVCIALNSSSSWWNFTSVAS